MHVLFVGGGTGGHLTPATGLAEELRARGHRTRFLCNGRAVEKAYFQEADEPHSLGLDDSRLPKSMALVRAMLRVRREARLFVPDVVVALGGAGSTAALAVPGRVPLVVLEGNFVVGKSVKLLDRFARYTLTLFPETARQLRRGRCIGPIGRDALSPIEVKRARMQFGLAPDCPVLLVMGGSQGAQDLNAAAQRMVPAFAAQGVQLLAVAGPGKAYDLQKACEEVGLSACVMDHCDEMGAAYSAADFALCRGGAATMAELWLHRLPAAVAPYPYHKDRQQEHNARALEPGVVLIEPRDPADDAVVLHCLGDLLERRRMAAYLEKIAPTDGRHSAADLLEEIAFRKA
ncbi:MAG: UDP-N-acetylglucosamine--N-acetylmuramyl-(pentapeptide) pyrophosphoryl-undecaprenol N-acetylglucosamine transferase [Planctomycetes bacterium]|nr:UDP-N-acetylglucosamine--N-acetylmuramyl-(pentapeptide) pyrophosphoryl-undecaprenol N-acetylglucosamine transferase [Planctomycetota bacterium]